MALTDQYALATDEAFAQRITLCAVKAALDVMAEAAPSPERRAFAGVILRNPHGTAQNVALAVATNTAVTAASTDSDLQWTVNSAFDAFAQAFGG